MNPKPFIIRHSANGILEYIDPESVPYLGYLPQDIVGTDTLQLYRPSDLAYLRQVYEMIVKEGAVHRSKPYRLVLYCNKNNSFFFKQINNFLFCLFLQRMLTQNGDYLKLETEWSSFINPWSRKLEFVIGKHFVVEVILFYLKFVSIYINRYILFDNGRRIFII